MKKKQASYEIPLELNIPEFVRVWEKWLSHLKEKGCPPTSHALELQLRKLSAFGRVKRAIDCVEYSIEHNYQGLYKPKVEYARHVTVRETWRRTTAVDEFINAELGSTKPTALAKRLWDGMSPEEKKDAGRHISAERRRELESPRA